MRINAGSKITKDDVYLVVTYARKKGNDIWIEDIAVGPKGAITFYCSSLNGKRATNRGDGARAASWTAWGYLIADLFKRDPNAVIGQYRGMKDFAAQCRSYKPK